MKTDSFFFQFFSQFPAAFFTLIDEDTQKGGKYIFKAVEVKGQAFRVDGIFLPQSKEDPIYFVEVQFGKELDFYFRFFGEIFLYLRQYEPENNWRAVVIFPEETVDPGVHPHYREFFETNRLRRVYLSKLAPAHLERFPLNLLQIITTPNEEIADVVKKVARQVSDEIQDPNLKDIAVELLINLLINKLSNLTREEIEKMTEPLMSNIKKTRFYQEVKQEGRQEGRQVGRQEGRQEGLRQTIYDILEIKFGAAGLRLFDQMTKTMPIEVLEEIRVGLKKAQSVPDAEKIINAHNSG